MACNRIVAISCGILNRIIVTHTLEMTTQLDSSNEMLAKIRFIDSLYLYSDLSVEHIAKTLKMDVAQVQKIVDNLIRKDTLEVIYEQADTPVEQIMRRDVAILDVSKSALDAATMMIKKGVGCVVVTAGDKPYGMVTERDILCEMTVFDKKLADLSLEVIASRPLVQVSPLETVRDVADLMVEN